MRGWPSGGGCRPGRRAAGREGSGGRRRRARGGRRSAASGRSHRALRPAKTLTLKRLGSRPEAACASRATRASSARSGCIAWVLKPSPWRPAMPAMRGPKPATTMGGGGSGRRKPDGRSSRNCDPTKLDSSPLQSRRSTCAVSATRSARTRSGETSMLSASCSRAYDIERVAPAPRPRSRRPPETCWSVAAMLASSPGCRRPVLSTSGPSVRRCVASASAVSVVQASGTPASACSSGSRR